MSEIGVRRKHMAMLLVSALGAVGFVYFTCGRKDTASEEMSRLCCVAFSFKRQNVMSLVLQRDG